MDPATIATTVVAFLAPYLAEGGRAVAKKAGEALVGALERRFKGQPVPQTALDDFKADPQDGDNQGALRKELKKALAADDEFLAELAQLLEQAQAEAPAPTYHAEVHGSGAVAQGPGAAAAGAGGFVVSGDVKGPIITGDGNVVGDHSHTSVRLDERKKRK